ncbi:MAG: TIGR04013 family B12-binding domain/radical SAM domain-containing protein [Candidatus Thorarchaeota archaeon]
MKKGTALIVFYQKENIYSFNALIAAIETEPKLDDIDIFFIRGKENLINKLSKLIFIYKRVILGVSFFTTQVWKIYQLLKILKKNYQDKIIFIAGGAHSTGDPLGTLKMGFDVVVVGEGEKTLIELILKIKNDDLFNNIKGIAFLNQKKELVYTENRSPISLDNYPPLPVKHIKFGAIEITRGCPYTCYFCQTSYLFGTKPRHRSIDNICKAVKIMALKYGKNDIRFISPNAFSYGSMDGKTLNLEKLEELLKQIKSIISSSGRIFLGSFPSEVRPEHVTIDSLKLVKNYAANDNIVIGAQSGSQKLLDLCHRGHNVEDVYKAVELTVQSGVKANVDFIFGLPYENETDIDLTLKVITDLTEIGARIHAHSFLPLPQTVFASFNAKKIHKKIRKVLHDLNIKGLAYGEWKKQEDIAIKISKYLKSKEVKDLF